jgi:hypothetical protein
VKLGNPRLAKARKIARRSHVTYRPPADVMNLLKDWSLSYHSCAAKLNALGIKAARKQSWYGSSVRNVLLR